MPFKVCEIINLPKKLKPLKNNFKKTMNHHKNAKIIGQSPFFGLKCCEVAMGRFNM